jgi:hypothetical protein
MAIGTIERVKEIYRLFKKHQFQLAGLRSFGTYVTDAEAAQKLLEWPAPVSCLPGGSTVEPE